MPANTFILGAAAATVIARKHPCSIIKFEAQSTVDLSSYFFQIHDSPVAPVAGAVPVKSWPAAECSYKEFKRGELSLAKGCFVAVSSTALTYTAQASNITLLQIEFTDADVPVGITTASATANQSLAVWAHGSAPNRLYQVRLKRIDTADATLYLQWRAVNGSDYVILGAVNISSMVANEVKSFFFGDGGTEIRGLEAPPSLVECLGCTVKICTLPTNDVAAADTFDIYADYKNG